MKIIDAYYEPIVRVNCNCLGGDDYVEFHRDKSFLSNKDKCAYYVKFIDNDKWSFSTRLRTLYIYRKYWKNFINGERQTYNGISLNYDQVSELYLTLYNDALENEIIVSEDIKKIEKWEPQHSFEKYNLEYPEDILYILFKSQEGFVFSVETLYKNPAEFKLSWAFDLSITKKEIKRYTRNFLFKNRKFFCQENEMFFYKDDVVDLLCVMNFVLRKTIIKEDKKILEL